MPSGLMSNTVGADSGLKTDPRRLPAPLTAAAAAAAAATAARWALKRSRSMLSSSAARSAVPLLVVPDGAMMELVREPRYSAWKKKELKLVLSSG